MKSIEYIFKNMYFFEWHWKNKEMSNREAKDILYMDYYFPKIQSFEFLFAYRDWLQKQ